MWSLLPDYQETVRSAWQTQVTGTKMYCLVQKLRAVKQALKELNRLKVHNIEGKYWEEGSKLKTCQEKLHSDPLNSELREEEQQLLSSFSFISKAYHSFLAQKSKLHWLKEGDRNTAAFHRGIRSRNSINKIYGVIDINGVKVEGETEVANCFLEYFEDLLGKEVEREQIFSNLIREGAILTAEHRTQLEAPFTDLEIKEALWSINQNKSPGPDGFGSGFYISAWETMGKEFTEAIMEVLNSEKLLRQVNSTVLTLVPKSRNPESVVDYRPIACCNVVMKCISKVLSKRLANILPAIISGNQTGFVAGRNIAHNILICAEILRTFHRQKGTPKCLIKMDIKKAFDTVSWSFIEEMMYALDFPAKFIRLIMLCISTVSYSVNFNGSVKGFFRGKRGLRQGDPLSPLLFAISMEYLSRILIKLRDRKDFKYLPGCKALALNHVAFADDLMIFCNGDVKSIYTLLRAFQTFSEASGLKVNPSKCSIYTSLMPEENLNRILHISGFQKGALPFKFLGVSLTGRKLNEQDCDYLVERMLSRLRTWAGSTLSYAGRLVLVNSVLNTLHCYWSSIFLLPQKAIKKIKSICRNYLWTGMPYYSKPPLVSWETCCKSKREGGLNIIDTAAWNLAAIGKQVWDIASKKEALWIKWIHSRFIKQQNWWNYRPKESSSWLWKNVCKAKAAIRNGFSGDHWNHTADHVYSLPSAYKWLQGSSPPVRWYSWVWNKYNQPKVSFICWLLAHKRLQTRDRLSRWHLSSSDFCPLCGIVQETVEHLFCRCRLSKWLLGRTTNLLEWNTGYSNHQAIRRWIWTRRTWTAQRKKKQEALLNLLLYQIWNWRNKAVHEHSLPHRESIWKCMLPHFKLAIQSLSPM